MYVGYCLFRAILIPSFCFMCSHILDTKLDSSSSSGSLPTRRSLGRPLTGAAGAAMRKKQQGKSKLDGVEALVKNSRSYRPESALHVGGNNADEDDYIDIEAEVAAVEAACAAALAASSASSASSESLPASKK